MSELKFVIYTTKKKKKIQYHYIVRPRVRYIYYLFIFIKTSHNTLEIVMNS